MLKWQFVNGESQAQPAHFQPVQSGVAWDPPAKLLAVSAWELAWQSFTPARAQEFACARCFGCVPPAHLTHRHLSRTFLPSSLSMKLTERSSSPERAHAPAQGHPAEARSDSGPWGNMPDPVAAVSEGGISTTTSRGGLAEQSHSDTGASSSQDFSPRQVTRRGAGAARVTDMDIQGATTTAALDDGWLAVVEEASVGVARQMTSILTVNIVKPAMSRHLPEVARMMATKVDPGLLGEPNINSEESSRNNETETAD